MGGNLLEVSECEENEMPEEEMVSAEGETVRAEGSKAVSESGSTESKTESEGLLTIDETAQAQEQAGKWADESV